MEGFQVVVTTKGQYSLDDKRPLYAGFTNCIIGNVRRKLIQFGTTFILTLCIWGHVSEIFDYWDNTFQTGNDIEYSTVIVVLIAGAVIGFAHVAAIVLRTVFATSCLLPLFAAYRLAMPNPAAFLGQSPPRPLRI